MSRCFPFPPPGYEGKHRADDLDVLNEAKSKEKKHKKDKTRKDKDRGDAKEKHRDKKEKDRKSKRKEKKEKHCDSNTDKDEDDSKFVQELDRRIRDGENGKGIQLLEKVPVLDTRNQEMETATNMSGRETDDIDKNRSINRRLDPQGFGNEYVGNTLVHNLGVTSIPRPRDDQNGWTLEDKEKHKGIGDVKHKHHRKQETKVKSENKRSNPGKPKNDNGVTNVGIDLLIISSNNSLNGAKIRKWKDTEANGFLHENEIRPHKMQKAVPHQSTANGTKVEAFQCIPNPNTVRLDKKDKPINGFIAAQKPFPSKPNPNHVIEPPKILPRHDSNSLTQKALPKMEDPVGEASRKPPHPDSKYLAEVLTVPTMAYWSENIDHDWLFQPSKLTGTTATVEDDQQHVWSDVVHIKSAGICALPYVIPY